MCLQGILTSPVPAVCLIRELQQEKPSTRSVEDHVRRTAKSEDGEICSGWMVPGGRGDMIAVSKSAFPMCSQAEF